MAKIISVASGKGGVGKSVSVTNLGLIAAKRGFRVVLADLDIGGADLHILLGQFEPGSTLTDFLTRRTQSLDTVLKSVPLCPELRLLPGTGDTLATANPTYATKKRLERHLRKLDADLVFIDVGAGTSYHALDFFLWADVPVVVATPDPTAIVDVYKFVKLAAIRRVLFAFVSRDAVSTTLAGRDFKSIEEVLQVASAVDGNAQEIVRRALATFEPRLLVSHTTSTSKLNTQHLRKVLREFVGSDLAVLGEVPRDDRISRSVRTFTPIVESAPDSAAAQAYERIADSLLTTVPERELASRESL